MASELLEWHILAKVAGANKQALLAWWGQVVCTDHTILSNKEYLKNVSESEGVVKTYGPLC